MVRVLGRVQPVRIYELVAKAGTSLPTEQEKALKSYAAGLEAYRQKIWDEALALFGQALTVHPDEGPARTMAERCATYQATPPPDGWDGVFEQAFKK